MGSNDNLLRWNMDCFSLLYFGNSQFFSFMSLFKHGVWFSFCVKQFPSAEFGICGHIAAYS